MHAYYILNKINKFILTLNIIYEIIHTFIFVVYLLEITFETYYTFLVWSLHKYKCLWDVGGKDRGLSFQELASHIHTLRLD